MPTRGVFLPREGQRNQEGGAEGVLDVELGRVPSSVGLHKAKIHVLARPVLAEVDGGVANWWDLRFTQHLHLMDRDNEEVPLEIEVRIDPQEPLSQCDEGHDVLDPIRV